MRRVLWTVGLIGEGEIGARGRGDLAAAVLTERAGTASESLGRAARASIVTLGEILVRIVRDLMVLTVEIMHVLLIAVNLRDFGKEERLRNCKETGDAEAQRMVQVSTQRA